MSKATLRIFSVAAGTFFCLAAGVWVSPESEAHTSPPYGRIESADTNLKCYKTIRDPYSVVCYRLSYRPLLKNGRFTFVPFLVQVPTPSNPPPPIIVDELPST